MKRALIVIMIFLLGAVGLFAASRFADQQGEITINEEVENNSETVSVVAENLNIPWSIAFLPEGDMLVTERPGSLKRIGSDGTSVNVATIEEVLHQGEGGLLGIALHPDFEDNNLLYLYYTYSGQGNATLNRVVRYEFTDNSLFEGEVIVDEIPGAVNHNGGRIRFGPDGYLFITTGDAAEPSLSQDRDSLAGKILRVTDEGEPAPGNPFESEIYSYGHRNPQGIDWINGQLWSSEHGARALDEINRIEAGRNYGWPEIEGDQRREGMETPVVHSGRDTWAPGGLVHHQGLVYFTGLRGGALYVFDPDDREAGVREYFKNEYGRLREIIVGPDGMLYVTTSNRDGRGSPRSQDDIILRIDPDLL
jgi:aldose sugar dehydrogenase